MASPPRAPISPAIARRCRSALRGFVEAIYFVYGNKAATQKVFAKYMRTNDPAVLEDSYNGYIKSIPKKPYPTLKGIQFMLDVLAPTLPNAKNFKPEQFVDLSFSPRDGERWFL